MPDRVLFVDDDESVLASYRRAFRKTFAIDTARGAEAALSLMERERPFTVIVSDQNMPGMDGIRFLAEVRRREPDTIRMMLTAHSTLEVAMEALSEGHIFRFLTKPCSSETMAQALTAAVTQYRLVMSEREVLREQLRQAQKMEAVGRLTAGIAHDFNNLLTVIGGRIELLLHSMPPAASAYRDAELALQTSVRAGALTRRLLAFSRKHTFEPKVLDLNSVVAGMAPMLRRLIQEDIEQIVTLAPEIGRVEADPAQLEQVILNLFINARDAMPTGGRLTVATGNIDIDPGPAGGDLRPGPYVIFTVTDTGGGMNPETQARIFEPFFTTKGADRGTGLGLATVHDIVQQSNGHITVRSTPGQGTTFTIYLPRLESDVSRVEPTLSAVDVPEGSETILLVEDEDALRDLVREVLEERGYTVLAAADGEEALQMCAHHSGAIHLLLTDVILPQLSGPELAERCAQRRGGIKVLYTSGYTGGAMEHHVLPTTGTAFVGKPFRTTAFLLKVREVLDAGSPSVLGTDVKD